MTSSISAASGVENQTGHDGYMPARGGHHSRQGDTKNVCFGGDIDNNRRKRNPLQESASFPGHSEGNVDMPLQRARKSNPAKTSIDLGWVSADPWQVDEGFSPRNTREPCSDDVATLFHEDFDLSSKSDNEMETDDLTECSDLAGFNDDVPRRSNDKSWIGGHKGNGPAQTSAPAKSKSKTSLSPRLGVLRSVASPVRLLPLPRQSLKKKKLVSFKVSFSKVEVRFYSRIVSDHPDCSGGPPIGIGWEYTPGQLFDVSKWEHVRCKVRKPPTELRLDHQKRERTLRAWGFGDKELAAAVRALNKSQAQRRTTVRNLGVQKMEETFEQAARKEKSWLLLRRA
jgi:hypothetical protein